MNDNESFERTLEECPGKRKRRSSILRLPDKKRDSTRDSRTVSFNDRCTYKELHYDGTSDITNLFLRDDMDLTLMDVVETTPCATPDATDNSDMNISANTYTEDRVNGTILESSDMDESSATLKANDSATEQIDMSVTMRQSNATNSQPNMSISMRRANSTTSQPNMSVTMRQGNSTCGQTDISVTMAHDSSVTGSNNDTSMTSRANSSTISSKSSSISQFEPDSIISNINPAESDISSIDNYTNYGAFYESNNVSMESYTSSLGDTLRDNIKALDDCIKKVDHDRDLSRRKLDEEIDHLFKFYRHYVNAKNKYEFAIAIFGLRHSLWLVLKVNPETYPHELMDVKIVVNKKDRHLYHFPAYMWALREYSKEGNGGYLTRLVINAQTFRRFLRSKFGNKKSAHLKD